MTDWKGRPDVPHWLNGEAASAEEYRQWLHNPLPNGKIKTLDMYLDCDVCKHIRYEKTIYFHRANWWFWTRRAYLAWKAAWWWFLHPRCVQCRFNEKIGRQI